MASSNNKTPVGEEWCSIDVKVIKCSYTWTINNFRLREEKPGEQLQSPVFWPTSDKELKWCLTVCPRGDNEKYEDFVSLFLTPSSCKTAHARAKFKFTILPAKFEKRRFENSQIPFKFQKLGRGFGFLSFIKRDVLLNEANELLSDGNLVILCEIEMMADSVDIANQSKYRLLDDVSSLFGNEKFSDFIFTVEDKNIPAHKAILAARSPVFAAMFEHEMEEKKENHAIIADIDHVVMTEMLKYIYTGKLGNIEKIAESLFAAADKYDLKILKEMCEKVLCSKLAVENAANILILADLHSAEELKTQVMDFIVSHATDVMDTSGWENMIPTYPHLIVEVCRALGTSFISLKEYSPIENLNASLKKLLR